MAVVSKNIFSRAIGKEHTVLECEGCGAQWEPQVWCVLHDRNANDPYGRSLVNYDGSAAYDHERNRSHKAIQSFMAEHEKCVVQPQQVYVSERGVTVVDKRRFAL